MNVSLKLWLCYFSIVIALGITAGAGLITGWGRWYSPSLPYRWQTEAILSGRVALSASPTAAEHDMIWAQGGVQQAWGLGVPLWRLPFEAVARLFGQPAFPDRVVFAIAIALVAYIILFTFSAPNEKARRSQGNFEAWSFWRTILFSLCLLIFPPFLTLCRGPFNVYEEAVAYGYLYSIGLFTGLVAFQRRQSVRRYVTISFLSSFAPFIRPTMLAYGFATIFIAFYYTRKAKWLWWKSLSGLLSFGLGGALLFWSNLIRFGSGLEFGSGLNLSGLDVMFTSRFQAPFSNVSLFSAARELFGCLFSLNILNGFDVYRKGIVAFQSPIPRWRHFYQSTFDYSFLLIIITCWIFTVWRWYKRRRHYRFITIESEQETASIWSFMSFVLLFVFYMRFHVISSRYILDFSAAIAVAILGVLSAVRFPNKVWSTKSKLWAAIILGTFATWWAVEVCTDKVFPARPVLSRTEVLDVLNQKYPNLKSLPRSYVAGTNLASLTGIGQNGNGWTDSEGRTGSMVVLFISNPGTVVLDVAPAPGTTVTEKDFSYIRAKIGLEPLTLKSMEKTDHGRVLTFSPPKRKAYRKGIQVLFIAFVYAKDFNKKYSPFRLLSVSCRRE